MKLTYFPCDERYKKPVGGVRVNEEFTVFFWFTIKNSIDTILPNDSHRIFAKACIS